MEASRPATPPIRFGAFEVHPRSGELRKAGRRVRLQDQPFRVLLTLLEVPGEVVTREELQRRLWPQESFGDFEHGVNVAIAKIRTALNDSAENPRYIETLPRRGYRFVYPITAPAKQEGSGPGGLNSGPPQANIEGKTGRETGRRAARVRSAVAVLAAAAIAAGGIWHPGARKLSGKDKIVLADFANSTGDPSFDGALRRGLAVELEQSPFLSIVSDKQMQQTLQMMKQPLETKATPEIAREICERTSSTAVLGGSIAQIGTQYSVILKAEICQAGESLASTAVVAKDKDHVLDALGRASSEMRRRLGESLSTVEKFGTPLEQATTPSLEALQAYDMAYKTADQGNYVAAIPLFRRAIDLDPNFAMAYTLLGMMQWNVGIDESVKNLRRGYELRTAVSQREKFFIEFEYYAVKDSEFERALQIAHLWAKTYPRDCVPRGEAGSLYAGVDDEEVLREYLVAHQLCPEDSLAASGVIAAYSHLDRYAEARAVAREALAKNPESFEIHRALYYLAFLENDSAAMQEQLVFSNGKPGLEDQLQFFEAEAAAYQGRMRRSRELSWQAVNSAQRANEYERAELDAEIEGLRLAMAGNKTEARRQLRAALRLPKSVGDHFWTALAWAFIGDIDRAKALAEKIGHEGQEDPYTQFVAKPQLQAMLALAEHNAPKAIEILQPSPYESRFKVSPNVYFRGLAYLANGQGKEAEGEFQSMVNHPGLMEIRLEGALANLQIGRAYALQGENPKARGAYEKFFRLWKDADADVPILKQAQAEYAKLN